MQVVWSRLLSMIIGSSTYAFTIVLALFLIDLRSAPGLSPWSKAGSGLRRSILLVQVLTALSLFLSLRLEFSSHY